VRGISDCSNGGYFVCPETPEIPAPSREEQARAEYIRAEMQKLGLADIRMDDKLNVSGVRRGTGGGPTVVFAAHTDTVFPEGTPIKVRREGDTSPHPELETMRATSWRH
jgi:acetylornithine deacetylase/succinyl-diaminopimelate desuccinylase-like protein